MTHVDRSTEAPSATIPMGSVLARTTSTDVVPGSNLRSARAGSTLIQLLPSRDLGRIGLAGRSSPATVASLRDRGDIVDLAADEGTPIDLLWLGEGGDSLMPGDRRLAGLAARLTLDGLVVGEVGGVRSAGALRRLRADLGRVGLGTDLLVWLRPRSGPIRTIVPVADEASIRFLLGHGLAASLVRVRGRQRLPMLAGLERRVASSRLGDRLSRRIGFVARRSLDGPGRQPTEATGAVAPDQAGAPRWLVEALGGGGLAIGDHRWAFSVPGDYESQKAIWYLFGPGSVEPDLVVKMTRDPAFNGRLENEVTMLRRLEQVDLGPRIDVPQPMMLGGSNGLAIAAESRVVGDPFAARARVGPADPALRTAVDWLTGMGAATRTAAEPPAVRAALTLGLERCSRLYALTAMEQAFLADRIERVVDSGCPTVFMHGDPGTWNLLLTADSHLGILDWEAAEPDGLPLWDLFHLLRAYAMLASRPWLPHRSLRLARRHLVTGSALTPAFAAAVAGYRDALELPTEVVEPLYHLGWVHRAVKEAARLAPDRLDRGHYIRLLRAGMSGGSTAGLDLLVGRAARRSG
jgi:hypothetical protein